MKADVMLDLEGAAAWRRIVKAVNDLQLEEPSRGSGGNERPIQPHRNAP